MPAFFLGGWGGLAIDACWVGDSGEWGFDEISFMYFGRVFLDVLSFWIFWAFLCRRESGVHHGEWLGG